ncbi:NmrA domain-containing protein [Mycena kentingensis (nom. inval.)]|nr:NmrA domain-containing protein [Mycena kentingensis (nom. inval.)]
MRDFPQELVDKVVYFVADDPGTLYSCSLVARSFTPASQKRLFAHLRLSLETNLSRVRGLLKLLGHPPHLALYVDRLDLRCPNLQWNQRTITMFCDFLARLARVQELSLDLAMSTKPWKNYSAATHRVLAAAVSLPAVVSVELDRFTFQDPSELTDALKPCSDKLRDLQLSWPSIIRDAGATESGLATRLSRLKVHVGDVRTIRSLASMGPWASLVDLDLFVNQLKAANVQPHLQKMLDGSAQLRNLCLDINIFSDDRPSFSISSLSELRSLEIRLSRPISSSAIGYLTSILATAAAPSRLRKINIGIDLSDPWNVLRIPTWNGLEAAVLDGTNAIATTTEEFNLVLLVNPRNNTLNADSYHCAQQALRISWQEMPATEEQKLILVIGATGAQGQAVIDALLAPPSSYAVRALTRDPQSKQALELAARGVECVTGSFQDFDSVARALEGAYGVWVNTDGFTVGEMQEIYSGMRIFESAKRTTTLRHYVYSGLIYASKATDFNLDYKTDHLDAKGRVCDWMRAQSSVVSDTELSWSIVNTGPYMELLFGGLFDPINIRADGTVVFASPVGKGTVPMIALKDIGWWARYTFDHRAETSGQELKVTSELVSWDHLVATFTKVTGIPAVYVPQTLDEWWANFDDGINNPIAGDHTPGDGSTTVKENFSAFWRVLRDDVMARTKDVEWVRSVHPGTYTLERWMRENNYKGRAGAVMKNSQDGKRGWGLNMEVVEKL